jgi:glucose-1-phosphate thymidylyltransferase
LDILSSAGIRNFLVVINPQDKELEHFLLGTAGDFGPLRLIHQKEPLGMADALSQAKPWIRDDFVLFACDNLLAPEVVQSMLAHWRSRPDLEALLAVLEVPDEQVSSSGIVEMRHKRILRIVEKPSVRSAPSRIASIPLYCLRNSVLDELDQVPLSPRGEYEFQDALQMLLDKGVSMEGWLIQTRWTLTSGQDLLRINLNALTHHLPALDVQTKQIGLGVGLIPPIWIQENVLIGDHARVGPYVFIESGGQVGAGASLENCLVLRTGRVPESEITSGRIYF